MGMSRREIETVLDTAMAAFTNGHTDIALPMAVAGLNLARKSLPETDWREAFSRPWRRTRCGRPCSKTP